MNKRLIFSALFLLGFLIIGLGMYFYFANKEMEKEALIENQIWVEKKALDLEMEQVDREKIIHFIENSLPKKIDVKNIELFFHDALNIEKTSEEELQERIFAELHYAIKEQDIDMLVTLFDIHSYMEFVNLYPNHDELVAARNQLLSLINRSGEYDSISYIRKDEKSFTVVFNYKAGNPIKMNMNVKRYTEDGTKDHYYYAINSSFIAFFDTFNKSSIK
ncbi:hypothetical protein ACQKNX_22665 [Lysinibacillus sp. NPDC093712]|uniref:hypothetical protein n=1 Tax=Lysinibacillus sp. NPDC093712 TaxID=3390579 RepID=UPI003CFCC1AC